ncbi:MAG TPA: hypothetical protein DD727_03735 [Clostridiales bacterium]|nr:hypothetical protein [Clostridiales bacterium]
MRFGVCAGPNMLDQAAEAGFDYIELAAAPIAGMEKEVYQELVRKMAGSPIKAEAFNIFLPGTMKIIGPEASLETLEAYLYKALPRLRELGGKVIVFGSGLTRRIPAEWPPESARSQFAQALQICGDAAGKAGMTIALEPLNHKDVDLIINAAQGLDLVRELAHPHVRLLVDTFHMYVESEDYSVLSGMAGWLAHVHIARGEGRKYPADPSEDRYGEFFDALQDIGYQGRISIEASCTDFRTDAPIALQILRSTG